MLNITEIWQRIFTQGVCVTGTDTGVGKTWVSGALSFFLKSEGINAKVFKPIQTGRCELLPHELDSALLKEMSGDDGSESEICPYTFDPPVAPWIAQLRDGTNISFEQFIQAAQIRLADHGVLVVEGAGGLAVPFAHKESDRTRCVGLVEISLALQLPLLVVARPSLGTVNHTVLTIEYARRRGCEVLGVIMNGRTHESQQFIEENIAMIEQATDVPVIAVMPLVSDPMIYRSLFVAEMKRLITGTMNGGF